MATADRPPDHIDLGDVVLRAPRLDDAEALLAATTVDLDHLGPWMAWATPEQNTLDQRRAFIQEDLQRPEGDRSATYLVVDPADGTVLGSTGLYDRVGPDGLDFWSAGAPRGGGDGGGAPNPFAGPGGPNPFMVPDGAPLGAPWDGPDALRAAAKSEREEQEAMGSN